MNKKRTGTILLNTFAIIFMLISFAILIISMLPSETLRESRDLLRYMFGACALSFSVAFVGFYLRRKSWAIYNVRVLVECIGEARVSGFCSVTFETEEGESLRLNVPKPHIRFSEDDVGILYYKALEKNKPLFDKFKCEGKSIARSQEAETGKRCKNCDAVLSYDKFSTKPVCKHCA